MSEADQVEERIDPVIVWSEYERWRSTAATIWLEHERMYGAPEQAYLFAYLLKFLSYKPDWEFCPLYGPEGVGLTLIFSAHVENQRQAKTKIASYSFFGYRHLLDKPEFLKHFMLFSRHAILQAEHHEIDEFFQMGGVQVVAPHPGSTKRTVQIPAELRPKPSFHHGPPFFAWSLTEENMQRMLDVRPFNKFTDRTS